MYYNVKYVFIKLWQISDFRRIVDEVSFLLGWYVASVGGGWTDVSGQPVGSIFKSQEVQEEGVK